MDASNYTLRVAWEQVEHIIKQEMRFHVDDLTRQLRLRKEGESAGIFDLDKDKDILMIEEHIRSFERVLKYYGEDGS